MLRMLLQPVQAYLVGTPLSTPHTSPHHGPHRAWHEGYRCGRL